MIMNSCHALGTDMAMQTLYCQEKDLQIVLKSNGLSSSPLYKV